MLDDQSQGEVNSVSRTTSIIVFALCGGVIAFGAYVLFFHEIKQAQAMGMLTYGSLGFAGLETVMCLIVPQVLVRSGRKLMATGSLKYQGSEGPTVHTDAGKLALVYQQTTIIGCALLEGAAFFALIAYMIEGHLAALIAAVVMLIGVALHMPLGDRLSSWVENQLQIIDEEKRFSFLK